MKYGAVIFQTDYAIRPDEIARAAEDHGFESIFFVEHTHIPASRRTPYPLGGELPREYSHTMDLFVALTMAAAATRKINVGSGICLVIEHDPIVVLRDHCQCKVGIGKIGVEFQCLLCLCPRLWDELDL